MIRAANLCTTTSQGFASVLKHVYKGDVFQIHNGFDELCEPKTYRGVQKKSITILYVGTIYREFQDVSIVLQALEHYYSTQRMDHKEKVLPITLTFVGFSTDIITNYYKSRSLKFPPWIKLHGLVDYKTAKKMRERADFVLLFNWEDSSQQGVLSTKLYEYIASGTPIICTGRNYRDESSKILQQTNTATWFHDPLDLSEFLRKCVLNGVVNYAPNYEEIAKYSRSQQAQRISDLIYKVLQDRAQA